MSLDVFPRRNLGRAEHWGFTVENRLKALARKQTTLSERAESFDRYSATAASDLANLVEETEALTEQIQEALEAFPRYFTANASNSGFGIGGDWTTVALLNVPVPDGFQTCDLAAEGVLFAQQETATVYDLFIWPFPLSSVSSEYGPRPLGFHNGIDFAQAGGTPIIAAADGVVSLKNTYPDWGNYVRINHTALTGIPNNWTGYAHMNAPAIVNVGDYVTQGQVIGYVGTTGFSTGNHLHFETAVEGSRMDPRLFMSAWEGTGTTGYARAEGRIVINGSASPTFLPFSEVGLGPQQMVFPIWGSTFPVPWSQVEVRLDVRLPGRASPAGYPNVATLTVKGGFSK